MSLAELFGVYLMHGQMTEGQGGNRPEIQIFHGGSEWGDWFLLVVSHDALSGDRLWLFNQPRYLIV